MKEVTLDLLEQSCSDLLQGTEIIHVDLDMIEEIGCITGRETQKEVV